MILGACMGGRVDQQDHRVEYRNMGIKGSNRAARMEENIEILRRLWMEERVTYEGEFHKLEAAFIEPKPVQTPPPIWVTSNPGLKTGKPHIIERSLRRVARMGDGWMTTANPADQFDQLRRSVFKYAADYGRSFDDLPCCLYYNININEDREAAFQESKKYLDQYYSISYSREAWRTGWRWAHPSSVSGSFRPTLMPEPPTSCSGAPPGTRRGSSGGAWKKCCPISCSRCGMRN